MRADNAEAETARIAREKAAKEAREADEKEHQEEMAARRERDKKMAEEHKEKMKERKEAFEKMFKHVWGTGEAGVNYATCTVNDKATADKMITALFQDTLIAEATVADHVTMSFKNETQLKEINTSLHVSQGQYRIDMVTSDDRVAEMIEVAVANSGQSNLDFLVTPMENAGPDYISWVKNQTIE